MPAPLHCTVTTPERKIFEGTVDFVVVPATDGELGILPGHAPLVGALGFGELRLDILGQGKVRYFIDGGFVQVADGRVVVLAASADPASAIDRAADETKLRDLRAAPPPTGATFDERDAYAREVSVLRARLAVAERG